MINGHNKSFGNEPTNGRSLYDHADYAVYYVDSYFFSVFHTKRIAVGLRNAIKGYYNFFSQRIYFFFFLFFQMPASVYQKLTSSADLAASAHEATAWSDRGSADGTDIGGKFRFVTLNVFDSKILKMFG